MTPDQIIDQIWQLSWYQVAKVAIFDDLILFSKIWGVIVFIFVITFAWVSFEYLKEKRKSK